MATFKITKGYDIKLDGRPSPEIVNEPDSSIAIVYPLEFKGFKQRLKVAEGDAVKCGTELLENKNDTKFKLRAPAGGTIKQIIRGERRFIEKIVIDIAEEEVSENFQKYSLKDILNISRDAALDQLLNTGYISFIKQRPFSNIANPKEMPKSIFVNGMNTGPFQADANIVTQDDPEAFQAGLNLLTRLTEGEVYLCVGENSCETLTSAENVQVHTFSGPHPSGNSSVHISRIQPMKPTDIIWTVKAVDLVLIGRLFLDGELPKHRIISLGGNGVKEEGRKHYKMRIGGNLSPLLSKYLEGEEQRVLNGDILSGTIIQQNDGLRLGQSAITVIPEGRERHFMGWTMPGLNVLSFTRTFVSSWVSRNKTWALNSNENGGERSMVLTGHYDKVMPLNIMVDFLVRAVLAGDTEEAIKLGILETDPEDFALCDFICPSKTELQETIRQGLADIEEEGI